MNRYVCLHGHFYQPPRENPWLETIELTESAYPYDDWNQRITAECYASNAAGRILDDNHCIQQIINNYTKISFNFGPTLLSWMAKNAPEAYESILAADKESQLLFSGHGAALAQVYNHMIMPLANQRDKVTQVVWGLKDFESRFGRKAEGMWLSETAVDVASLEVLAAYEVKFVILAPHQAKRIRKMGSDTWTDVTDARINPQRPYHCPLPSGKSISIFFYDGPISQEIAFNGLLSNGEGFAKRLVSVLPKDDKAPALMHIATDGETYGHHHRYGEMALSYCLHYIEKESLATITIYGEYLAKHVPTYEVEILENTSWSCMHGIERWRSNCGCCSGGHPTWDQKWRGPLRDALDWLRDEVSDVYEKALEVYEVNAWEVRNRYIDVILNRSKECMDSFFEEIIPRALEKDERIFILKMCEMQRHAMLMYTSCGWFFDEISGIETTQIMQYAARVIQLAKEAGRLDLEQGFMDRLSLAPSNLSQHKNGRQLYEQMIKPSIVDLVRVGAHYAVSSLFQKFSDKTTIYCYEVTNHVNDFMRAGKQKLVMGRVRLVSVITREEIEVSYAAFHLGDHNLNAGVQAAMSLEDFESMHAQIKDVFLSGDTPEVIRLIDKCFSSNNYTLRHLFKHGQKKILDKILSVVLENAEERFRHIYEESYPFMQAGRDLQISLPPALRSTGEFVLNRDIRDVFDADHIDLDRLRTLVEEVNRWSFIVDREMLNFVAMTKVNRLMEEFRRVPLDLDLLKFINALFQALRQLPIPLELWKAQNVLFTLKQGVYLQQLKKEKEGDVRAAKWVQLFDKLGKLLYVVV